MLLGEKIDLGILLVVSVWFFMDRFGLYFRKP